MDNNDNNIQMAEGKLGRVVVLRLKPGTDVLLGLQEACERQQRCGPQRHREPCPCALLRPH